MFVVTQLLSLSLDLVTLEDLMLELPGVHIERMSVRQAALLKQVRHVCSGAHRLEVELGGRDYAYM
jgi:hypothetical protein